MREHELTSDETVAIFTTHAATLLFEELDGKPNRQREFLTRLRNALESPTPAAFVEKPFRGVDHVDQFRAGDVMRGYCVFEDELPSYNVFYFLAVTDHDYDAHPVAKFDREAAEISETLGNLSAEAEVESYLDERDALDADDVDGLCDRL